jgi:hypothetical protein
MAKRTPVMKTLDELIDRDEKVLFRAPSGRLPGDGLHALLALAAGIGLVALTGLVTFDRVGLASLALTFAGYVPVLAWQYRRYLSCEGVVTDRRLLHRTGWIRPKLTVVYAVNVKRIKATEARLRIFKQSGVPLDLDHPSDAWGLGVALVHAAGLAPPHLAPRKVLLAEELHATVGMASTVAIAILPVTWLVKTMFAGVSLLAALGLGTAGIFIGLLSLLPGAYIGGLLTLILLRPFFSHREVADWLGSSSLFWPAEKDAREIDWDGRLLLRLARVLYPR